MSGFGKTTIFNSLLGNRPNAFCWASDYLIWSSFGRPNKILVAFGDRPFQALEMLTNTDNERHNVMTIPRIDLWSRWIKKANKIYIFKCTNLRILSNPTMTIYIHEFQLNEHAIVIAIIHYLLLSIKKIHCQMSTKPCLWAH